MTKIRVTREHIQKGKACSHLECPLALAISEKTGLVADVGYSGTKLFKNGKPHLEAIFRHDDKLKKFIADFDVGKHVKGFTFTMDLEGV